MGTMEPITTKLRRTRLFAGLPEEAVVALIERPGLARGAAGDPVPARQGDLVVLLDGGLAMGSNDGGEHIAAFSVEEGARDPAILYTIPANARLTLSRPSVSSRNRMNRKPLSGTMVYAPAVTSVTCSFTSPVATRSTL